MNRMLLIPGTFVLLSFCAWYFAGPATLRPHEPGGGPAANQYNAPEKYAAVPYSQNEIEEVCNRIRAQWSLAQIANETRPVYSRALRVQPKTGIAKLDDVLFSPEQQFFEGLLVGNLVVDRQGEVLSHPVVVDVDSEETSVYHERTWQSLDSWIGLVQSN